MNIQYIGEHLLPGEMGKFFVWLGFLAAIMATVLYLLTFLRKDNRLFLKRSARGFYILHALSLVGVTTALYHIILKHYFEYSYVWQYSSVELPMKYVISCFWAGQEGSFLVWALFQALIGLILVGIARNWESPVMIIFSLSQVF